MRLPIKGPKRKKAIECITGQLLANFVTRAAGKAHPFKGGMKDGLQVLETLQVSNSYGIT